MAHVPPKKPARVCLVTSHPLAGCYLTTLLRRDPRFRVVELNNHATLSGIFSVSVFVIDAGSLPVPLCECIARLRSRDPNARLLVLDQQSIDGDRLLGLRIQGFLTYDEVPENLLAAIRAVMRDKTWVRPELVEKYLNRALVAQNGGLSNQKFLTVREVEVMEFVKKRLSNAEIARHLGIRDSTVKFHISNLFSKLNVTSRRDLLSREDAFQLWNNLLRYSSLPHF